MLNLVLLLFLSLQSSEALRFNPQNGLTDSPSENHGSSYYYSEAEWMISGEHLFDDEGKEILHAGQDALKEKLLEEVAVLSHTDAKDIPAGFGVDFRRNSKKRHFKKKRRLASKEKELPEAREIPADPDSPLAWNEILLKNKHGVLTKFKISTKGYQKEDIPKCHQCLKQKCEDGGVNAFLKAVPWHGGEPGLPTQKRCSHMYTKLCEGQWQAKQQVNGTILLAGGYGCANKKSHFMHTVQDLGQWNQMME
jgi:hypothetical protein